MRGKGDSVLYQPIHRRITPAYAGKSVLGDPRRLLSGDHPRLCGEKMQTKSQACSGKGSPPPMRGKDSEDSGGV